MCLKPSSLKVSYLKLETRYDFIHEVTKRAINPKFHCAQEFHAFYEYLDKKAAAMFVI